MQKTNLIQLPLIVNVYSENCGGDYLRQPTLIERNKMISKGKKVLTVEDYNSIYNTCWTKDKNTCFDVVSIGLQREVKKCLGLPKNTSELKIMQILFSYLYAKNITSSGFNENDTKREAKELLAAYSIAA